MDSLGPNGTLPLPPAPFHPYAPPSLVTPPALPRPRLWPALLTLYFLAPAVGELLSGSTPPLLFISPFRLLFEAGLYGSGAILVRELARRRGLGWGSIVLLGAAYGILEEGLVVTSWFNPYWPDLGALSSYGRALDTSWIWALGLTMYHAVVSITIPILLVETIFADRAALPWLGRKGFRRFAAWLTLISLLGLIGFDFLSFRKQGYLHPPTMYLGALLLAVGLVWLALHPLRRGVPNVSARRAPGLWALRLAGLGMTAAFFFVFWGFPSLINSPQVTFITLALVGLFALWRVREWSGRSGWGAEQRLALASGVMGFFLLLAPLIEARPHDPTKPTTGMTLAALCWLAGLIWLAHHAGRSGRQRHTPAPLRAWY